MGYIEKRGERSWRLCVDVGMDATGKRDTRRKTVRIDDPALLRTTKRLADYLEMELAKFQMDVQAGTYVAPGKLHFSEFVDTWLARHVDVELEAKTRENYRHHMKRRIKPWFGHMRMDQIKPLHVRDFLDHLRTPAAALRGNKAPGSQTVIYAYRVLRSAFKSAVEWQVIPVSPMDGIKKPRETERREMQVYDETDLEALFTALQTEPVRVRAIVMLAVMGGLRRGEISGLEWRHVDLERLVLTIEQSIPKNENGEPVLKAPKTKRSTRRIALPAALATVLAEHKAEWERQRDLAPHTWPGEFLFCHESGQPHDPQWITEQWARVRETHKLKNIRLHDLRHTAATWMIAQGIHPKAIANRLGHVNIKTTMDVYGHIIESVDVAAASAFDAMPTGKNPE